MLEEDGCEVTGQDEAYFQKFQHGKLQGQVGLHVDNILLLGNTKFIKETIDLIISS